MNFCWYEMCVLVAQATSEEQTEVLLISLIVPLAQAKCEDQKEFWTVYKAKTDDEDKLYDSFIDWNDTEEQNKVRWDELDEDRVSEEQSSVDSHLLAEDEKYDTQYDNMTIRECDTHYDNMAIRECYTQFEKMTIC